MGRTLTVVAAPPNDGNTYPEDPNVEDILEVLRPFESDTYRIARTWSVSHLAKVLRNDLKAQDPPDIVQIIGHGRPGILFLAASWTHSLHGEKGTYVLDGNPYDYGVLDKCVRAPTHVYLLGCEVGTMTKTSEVADGTTLLFDLCRMWGCKVSAPEDLVMPGDFKEGVYSRRGSLVTAEGLIVRIPPQPKDPTIKKRGVGAPRR